MIRALLAGTVLAAFASLLVFVLYSTFIVLPVSLLAEAECLHHGYPNSTVTVWLERYCLSLDGAVTVRVTNLEAETNRPRWVKDKDGWEVLQ